jgi:hypothetical protein
LTSNFWVVPTVSDFFGDDWSMNMPSTLTTNGEWLANNGNYTPENTEGFEILQSPFFSIKLAEHGSFGFGFGMQFTSNYDYNSQHLSGDVHFANPDTTYFYPHSYFFQNAYEERILETI